MSSHEPKERIRNRSEIWNYCKPLGDGIAQCQLCKQKLSYKTTISNLKKHIVNRHRFDLQDEISNGKEKDNESAEDVGAQIDAAVADLCGSSEAPMESIDARESGIRIIETSGTISPKRSISKVLKQKFEAPENEFMLRRKKIKLQINLLEREAYLKTLEIMKLEREMGLPSSKFTSELIKPGTVYVLPSSSVMPHHMVTMEDIKNATEVTVIEKGDDED